MGDTAEAAARLFGQRRHGHWLEIGRDPTGRRVAVVCVCGTTRTMSSEALQTSTSCGCRPPGRAAKFVLAAEAAEQRRRAMLHDWRPSG